MTEQPDQARQTDEVPNPETGAGIGATGEPSSFEPEEDPDSVEQPAAPEEADEDTAAGTTRADPR